MPDVPITLTPWFDAKDNPPDNDRLVLTELGTSHYAWGDWWALQRDTMDWQCCAVQPPRVWCDPSPPGDDALTVEDLRVLAAEPTAPVGWKQRQEARIRLRRALDQIGHT